MGWEVEHGPGILDVLGTTDPRAVPVCPEHAAIALREDEEIRAIGWAAFLSSQRRPDGAALVARTVPGVHARKGVPRVTVLEVKRTRSDLLSDLRKGKMQAYSRVATHCYVAATPEALAGGTPGLPEDWGIVELRWDLWRGLWRGQVVRDRVLAAARVVRRAQPQRPADAAIVWSAAWAIANKLANQVLFHEGTGEQERDDPGFLPDSA